MTESKVFTLGRNRISGLKNIWLLAEYRSRNRKYKYIKIGRDLLQFNVSNVIFQQSELVSAANFRGKLNWTSTFYQNFCSFLALDRFEAICLCKYENFDFRPYSAFKFGGRYQRPKAENFRFRPKISASGIPLFKRVKIL